MQCTGYSLPFSFLLEPSTRKVELGMNSVRIVTYAESLACEFARLNRAWIERYFTLEAADLELLNNPHEKIILSGGQIFFAHIHRITVGTCAAQKLSGGDWELAKLGVDEKYQGKGVGRRLCERVIDFCWSHGAERIIIETNSILVPAVNLYSSLGFRKFTPEAKSPFARTNLFLELNKK